MKKPFRQRSKKLSVSGEWHVDCSCDIVKKNDNEKLIPMKKLFLLLFVVVPMLFAYPLTADAMKMSAPVYLGSIENTAYVGMHGPVSYFTIENAVANTGKKRIRDGKATYEEGCATFGKGDLAIYVHYSNKQIGSIGGERKENTIEKILANGNYTITAIRTDSDIVFYCVVGGYYDGDEFNIFGKLPDGRFIQYIDSQKLINSYNWWDEYPMLWYQNIRTENNAIIIPYREEFSKDQGELRFPWDEKAQWFGVEKR